MKAQFERQNQTIKNLETGIRTPYDSINAAKRQSHKIQMEKDRALGFGTVRVAT